MESIKKEELQNINGGFLKTTSLGIGLLLGGAIAFGIGIYSGYINPNKCK